LISFSFASFAPLRDIRDRVRGSCSSDHEHERRARA
jgi:hypothetical protein